VEPRARIPLMFISDRSQRTKHRRKSEKQPTRNTKMETFIAIGTASMIACYALIVYRALPQN
jgi:hypothetical protein